MKIILTSLFFLFIVASKSIAQQSDVNDLYFDFLQIRHEPLNSIEGIKKAQFLLENHSNNLKPQQLTSITYHLARLYEEDFNMEKAIPHYKKVIELEPNYYVPYRALGFYYFDQAINVYQTANRMQLNNNVQEYQLNIDGFKLIANETIQYLIKAQACDPDEETLSMINDLYDYLGNLKGKKNLKSVLRKQSRKCITLLDD